MTNQMTTIYEITNNICRHIPSEWIISLHMEQGAAYVEVQNPLGHAITSLLNPELDAADKSIQEQLEDALNVAIEVARAEKENKVCHGCGREIKVISYE